MSKIERGTAFFYSAMLATTVVFTVGQASRVPRVFRVICPGSYKATSGLNFLLASGTLDSNDTGFKEIARICSPKRYNEVVNFTCIPNQGRAFSRQGEGAFWATPVTVLRSDGQRLPWNSKSISDGISELRERSVLWWALAAFLLSLSFQVMHRFSKSSQPVSAQKKQEDNADCGTSGQVINPNEKQGD